MSSQPFIVSVRRRAGAHRVRCGATSAWSLLGILLLQSTLLASDAGSKSAGQSSGPQVNYAKRALQGFNLRYWLTNQMSFGLQAWDGYISPPYPNIGLEYPAESGIEHLYGGGPWIGAIVDGTRRVSEGYNGDNAAKYFRPDPNHPLRELIWRTSLSDSLTEPNRRGYDDDSDGQIDEDDLDGLDNDGDWVLATDDIGSDGISDSMEVGCKGGYDALTNPDPAFDNYEPTKTDFCHPDANGNFRRQDDPDLYTEQNGIPDHGEPNVDEDYGAMSDNDLYCTARDDNDAPAGHFPMGVRVTQKSYSWKTGTSADALSILEYSFQNVGSQTLQDVFVAFFTDADVGPVSTGNYYTRNYSCYIDSLRTGYVHNPIDIGSTPLGVAEIGASKPLDAMSHYFRWFNFTTHPSPGTVDSVLYEYMSGAAFPSEPIAPCESPWNPSDTRFLMSMGPLDSITPGNEITAVYALVSGETLDEMALSAARAKRIYDAEGFICPDVRLMDVGVGSVTLAWTPAQSPFGQVTSYRIYHGTSPGVYSDSIETTGLSSKISGLEDSSVYYFAIVGFDERGRRGAISDELSMAPDAPDGLVVNGEQRSISLQWNRNSAPNLLGYNVYRAVDQETSIVRLNPVPVTDTLFSDTVVAGDRVYRYSLTALSTHGLESPSSVERSGSLIPPAVPARFVVGHGTDFVRLEWDGNQEDDLAGYNIYRIAGPDTTKLNAGPLTAAEYTDSTVETAARYDYFIEAVDSTGASARTYPLAGYTVAHSQGVLVILDVCTPVSTDDATAFLHGILSGYQDSVLWAFPIIYVASGSPRLSEFSSIIWLTECQLPRSFQYPIALKGYVAGGGHLLAMGPGITLKSYPHHYQFLADLFGVNPLLGISSTADFAGAAGSNGFPTVAVDAPKLAYLGGRANFVESFDNIPPERIVYSYISDPMDSAREGKPVGIRAVRDDRNAYYFSFPLYHLDSADATALVRKVLTDFGEVLVDVATEGTELPTRFHLYDAYPNPFNPSTTIRFDVPVQGHIRLSLYDVLGRELDPLFDAELPPGRHEVRWDASGMASGIYYLRLRVGGGTRGEAGVSDLRKLLLVK